MVDPLTCLADLASNVDPRGIAALRAGAITLQSLVAHWESESRPDFLAYLRHAGVDSLKDRQTLANALGKAKRESRLAPSDAETVAPALPPSTPEVPAGQDAVASAAAASVDDDDDDFWGELIPLRDTAQAAGAGAPPAPPVEKTVGETPAPDAGLPASAARSPIAEAMAVPANVAEEAATAVDVVSTPSPEMAGVSAADDDTAPPSPGGGTDAEGSSGEDAREASADGWAGHDARLLAFLEANELLSLSQTGLVESSLRDYEQLPRLKLLSRLREAGVTSVSARQKFANALSRAVREGSLPADDVARPAAPAPKCDKCDGAHATDACPHFKKAREDHADSRLGAKRSMMGSCAGPAETLRAGAGRVVRQPGDGSCLFHSLAHGLRSADSVGEPGLSAAALRAQVVDFIGRNPDLQIADSPLSDWVQWDANCSVDDYVQKMSRKSTWGGGIECAAASHLKGVDVLVYESDGGGGFRRIGTFEPGTPPKPAEAHRSSPELTAAQAPPSPTPRDGGKRHAVRILYQGGVHYDALELVGHAAPPTLSAGTSASSATARTSALGFSSFGAPAHRAHEITARGGAGSDWES